MNLLLSICFLLLCCVGLHAQQPSYNFHKLGLQQGLHDGTTRCIGQDKMGYTWIGTTGALNRYDGKHVVHYTHVRGDSTSPYPSQPRSIHSNPAGRLWIGYETGLVEYHFDKANFARIAALENIYISAMASIGDSLLMLATRKGLYSYNVTSEILTAYSGSTQKGHEALQNLVLYDIAIKNNILYLASNNGLVVFDYVADAALSVSLAPMYHMGITSVAVDAQNRVWLGTFESIKLVRLSVDLKTLTIYDRFLSSDLSTQPLNVMDILVDSNDKVWVVTAIDGILQYHEETDAFSKILHQPNIPSSPSGNGYRCIFQDKQGIIWLGCDFWGVNFFEPDKFLFETILPHPDLLHERERGVGRAIAQDKDGNLWMATHDGVSWYNPSSGSFREWRNEPGKPKQLYNNLVRSILCDNENNIWIGTASGVNRYHTRTEQMEFIPSNLLPTRFYNSINKDRDGKVWFCTNDSATLYWYDPKTKTYDNICHHPQLKEFSRITPTSYLLEDSKDRIWISLSRYGLGMWDKRTGKTRLYKKPEDGRPGIPGNQIVDIKEDKDGWIWMSTFNGVCGLHPERDSFLVFDIKHGLPGNGASPLAIDSLNRIWVGVNGGLAMIETNRKNLTTFTVEDGLPYTGFPEHAGISLKDGQFIFPGYRGFIRFNPQAYSSAKETIPFYLSGYYVFQQAFLPPPEGEPYFLLRLKPGDNSFSFNLVAVNYTHPHQTWFAYMLDGFDEEWHYTQDPRAVYTNVPGGAYKFLFKAAVGNAGWEQITAKSLSVKVDTIFYRTIWFWGLMILLAAGAIYALYHYRLQQQGQIFSLETKAASLEKEKAMIQYESLKQHLNPHFLFNSLTSLRSLIKTDAATAAWFLDGLSKVYRYVLRSADQELVSLKDELEYVENFTGLQKVRFGEGLQMQIEIDEQFKGLLIAPAVLQNLVENAIKHNTTSVNKPLRIEITTNGEYVSVRNNLQRYRVVETSNKSGLISLKKLYRFYTEKEIRVTEDEHYFAVEIPLI